MHGEDSPTKPKSTAKPEITLSHKDIVIFFPHEDDPIIISIQLSYWNIKNVLMDPKSSANVLFCEAFERVQLDLDDLHPFRAPVVGFLGSRSWVTSPSRL